MSRIADDDIILEEIAREQPQRSVFWAFFYLALASFIADALAGRPIEVRASAPVWRSYVAIAELMSVVLDWLTARAENRSCARRTHARRSARSCSGVPPARLGPGPLEYPAALNHLDAF